MKEETPPANCLQLLAEAGIAFAADDAGCPAHTTAMPPRRFSARLAERRSNTVQEGKGLSEASTHSQRLTLPRRLRKAAGSTSNAAKRPAKGVVAVASKSTAPTTTASSPSSLSTHTPEPSTELPTCASVPSTQHSLGFTHPPSASTPVRRPGEEAPYKTLSKRSRATRRARDRKERRVGRTKGGEYTRAFEYKVCTRSFTMLLHIQ